MSTTVAAPMAIGAATVPTDSVALMPAAVGETIVVAVPEVTDKNSVFPSRLLKKASTSRGYGN
jgi:hypothetical protein